jgi:glycosyltransferase involved in cell wall biosynthesis
LEEYVGVVHHEDKELTESGETLISVLINTYNYGAYIREAVESALAQTLEPTEVIVVDDGSTDETQEVLEQHFGGNPKVRIIRQRNGGQLSAFVTGLENARGDILCFLDADDKYEPTHLESVAAGFGKHSDVDFLYTAHKTFGTEERTVQHAPEDTNLGFSLIVTMKVLLFLGTITSGLAMRRRLMLALLPVLRQAAPLWRIRADDCLVYGASLTGSKKLYLAAPTVRYRVHGKNAYAGSNESTEKAFLQAFRRQTFAHLVEEHVGIGDSVYLDLVTEFRSIEQPTRLVYRIYQRLNPRVNRNLLRRLKVAIRLFQHYKRHKAQWDEAVYTAFPNSTAKGLTDPRFIRRPRVL